MSLPRTWDDVRSALEARKAALIAEIAAYPPPIPGCDVQFNHLLEERGRIGAELKRLDEAMAGTGGGAALKRFVESCPFLQDAGE